MALDPNLNCKEQTKFRGDSPDSVCVAVCNDDGGSINPSASLVPSGWDYVVNAPTSTTDVWTYKDGGSGGSSVGVITVTYTDSSKENIFSVERTS